VSKGQTLARLEALLTRVRSRATEPRIAPAITAAPPVDAQPEVVAAAPVAAAAPAPPPVFALDEPTEDLESTQQRSVPSRSAPMRTEADIVVEVEVQATTQETVVAVPVDEVPAPAALESRERLVAAEPAATLVEPAPAAEPEPSPTLAVQIEEPVEELVPELIPEAEQVEEAPASSRRPVAPPPEERLEEMAFGSVEPEPPRHTPPPESGRLPAAPEVEFDGDITGVRNAPRSAHPPAAAPAPAPVIAIVPEATIAELSANDAVADVVSPAHAPAPTTFVGVLDQSIAL
jgi:hypothetical protein